MIFKIFWKIPASTSEELFKKYSQFLLLFLIFLCTVIIYKHRWWMCSAGIFFSCCFSSVCVLLLCCKVVEIKKKLWQFSLIHFFPILLSFNILAISFLYILISKIIFMCIKSRTSQKLWNVWIYINTKGKNEEHYILYKTAASIYKNDYNKW